MSKKNELDSFMKNFSSPVVNIEAITAEPTPEEKKALDDKRNAKRGRKAAGEAPASYKRVGFLCDTEILEKFEAVPYKTGKIKKELFEEALTYIIEKYS